MGTGLNIKFTQKLAQISLAANQRKHATLHWRGKFSLASPYIHLAADQADAMMCLLAHSAAVTFSITQLEVEFERHAVRKMCC